MKFHYTHISPNSRRALAAIYHLGYEPELVYTDPDSEANLKNNPNGLVPVLEDGPYVLWESNAIMQYVADKKGDTSLYPRDPQVRADIARWQFWAIAHLDPAAGPLLWEQPFKEFFGAGTPDASAVAEGQKNFREIAKILEARLSRHDWLVGSQITLADYAVAGFLMYADASKMPVGEFSGFRRWLDRVEAQPAWKKSGEAIRGIRPGERMGG